MEGGTGQTFGLAKHIVFRHRNVQNRIETDQLLFVHDSVGSDKLDKRRLDNRANFSIIDNYRSRALAILQGHYRANALYL
jgi:hypothetical protein